VFGETMAQFMTNLFWSDVLKEDENFGMTKTCWITVLGILLTPFILMKELAELKAVSVALFSSAIIFVAINLI
jgi:amino acid permease